MEANPRQLAMSVEDKIRNRNNWLKVIVALILVFILGLRITGSSITIDLNDFKFSDFLALTLALFAIWLSVLFYQKSTETANTFYDNTYRFTTDVSRIYRDEFEGAFGEKLSHMDAQLGRFPTAFPGNQVQTEKQIEKKEEEAEQVVKEKEAILEQLMKRAKVEEAEKDSIISNLRRRNMPWRKHKLSWNG